MIDDSSDSQNAPLTVLRPTTGWSAIPWAEIYEYRDLLLTLASRDIKLRYRQTAIGVLWVVLQPLIGAGVFTFVFGRVAKIPLGESHVPYFVFSFAGLLCWSIFSQLLQRCSDVMVTNAGLVSKIYFPRIVLPLSILGGVFLDFAVSAVLLVIFAIAYRVWPGANLIWVPWAILVTALLGLGLGMWAAALNVSYRDVRYVIPVVLQFLTWASPIAYPVSAVPKSLRFVVTLNPMAPVLEMFRQGSLGYPSSMPGGVLPVSVIALVVFLAGAMFFRRAERRFADII